MPRLAKNDPTTIGPYTVTSRLGTGGMGIVYQAERGHRRVAIKVLNQALIDNAEARARLIREAQTLQSLSSPHVARLLDWTVSEDEAWIVLRFINGPNLRQLVSSHGPVKGERWWSLAAGLAAALSTFHRQGVVHRDIKPSNIVVSDSGPVVIDFGISQVTDATRLTQTGTFQGSAAWVSPEQQFGEEGLPSDVFSLGSTLVYAAKGQSPWGAEDKMSIHELYKRVEANRPNLDGLTPEQKEFVMELLRSEPDDRPTADELVRRLGPCNVSLFSDPEWVSKMENIPFSPADRDSGSTTVPVISPEESQADESADITDSQTKTRKRGRTTSGEDREDTEKLPQPDNDGQPRKTKRGDPPPTEQSRPRKGIGLLVGAGAGAALAVAGVSILVAALGVVGSSGEESPRMTLEWIAGDLWGESPVLAPEVLDGYYTIGQETVSRTACIDDSESDLWSRGGLPVFEIEDGSGLWSAVGETQISESSNAPAGSGLSVSCDPGMELVMTSSVSREVIESRAQDGDCVALRYREPETALWVEREERWCVWLEGDPPSGALSLPLDN